MDELRFVRREDTTLIVANEAGEEFRLVVDDTVLSELRGLSRRERGATKIRPREIQALIRAGKSRAQVAKATGLEEADVERYEEPVLAERRYILGLAHAVPVRAEAHADDDQHFGAVINARLVTLEADTSEWDSWKEDEEGWMIGLEFIARETAHSAVWAFDHRKNTLSPITPDAVSISKQGDVGDRLIPKLRAVDDNELRGRFDSAAFDAPDLADSIAVGVTEEQPTIDPSPLQQDSVPTDAVEVEDPEAEYERRREIEQRAMKTDASSGADLSQTADLLDALRKRRGERERAIDASTAAQKNTDAAAAATADITDPSDRADRSDMTDDADTAPSPVVPRPADRLQHISPASAGPNRPASSDAPARTEQQTSQAKPRSIWSAGGVSREAKVTSLLQQKGSSSAHTETPTQSAEPEPEPQSQKPSAPPSKPEPARKGRASIPSWDDILFGTRSDEDPA